MQPFFRISLCEEDLELSRIIRQFEKFKDAAKLIEPIPEEWDDEFLVYQMSEGSITKRDWVLDHVYYKHAMIWMMMQRYELYAQREYMKKDPNER